MKRSAFFLSCLLACSACSSPVVTAQRTETIDGNRLQITSGTNSAGRYVAVENVDKRWEGSLKGGKEKWGVRRDLLKKTYRDEIEQVCGEWFYEEVQSAHYNMLDKDETMGGVAPVLGVTASMVAYAAAEASTDPANIPVSVYSEFRCRKDNEG